MSGAKANTDGAGGGAGTSDGRTDRAVLELEETEKKVEPRGRWHGFEIDLRSLAVFRVALGAVMLGDLIDRSRDLTAFYTDAGVLPSGLHPGIYGPFAYLSLHRYAMGSVWLQGALFALAGLVAVALILGWRSRLMAGAAWVLTLSLHRVSADAGGGGDALLRILLFWAMLVPLGARWSLDARSSRSEHRDDRGTVYLAIPGAALLLQVAMVYWFTAAMKSWGEIPPGQIRQWMWRDGSALGVALWNDSLATPAGAALRDRAGLIPLMTYGTLALEWLGPVLALLPVWRCGARLLAVVLFVAFHVGIEVTMTVGLFGYAALAAWTLFIPPCVWDRVSGPGLRPVGAVPGNRPETSATGPSRPTIAVASAALAYILLVNLSQLPGLGRLHPRLVALAGHTLMLDQRWSMFAPNPRDQYGWFVFQGRLADGRRVDLFRGGRPVSWEKPASVSREYPSMRWRVYMMNLGIQEARHVARLEPLARYLAREWNATHADAERLERLSMHVVIVDYRAPGEEPLRVLMCDYDAVKDRVVYVLPVARVP